MRAAAKLHREITDAQHAHILLVLLTEQRHRAGGDRLLVLHDFGLRRLVAPDLRVHQPLDRRAAPRASPAGSARSRSATDRAPPASLSAAHGCPAPCATPRAADASPCDSERLRAPRAVHLCARACRRADAALDQLAHMRMRGAALLRVTDHEAHAALPASSPASPTWPPDSA